MMRERLFNKKFLYLLGLILVIIAFVYTYNAVRPKHNEFVRVGDMHYIRSRHQAVLLKDGRVLIMGGANEKEAEIYDPKTRKFKLTGSMLENRRDFTVTLMPNGKILLAGGNWKSKSKRSTELYDPETGKFEKGPDMSFPRADHAATLLKDGRILITGGQNWDAHRVTFPLSVTIGQSEIYNPSKNKFELGSEMNIPRSMHKAILLEDGRAFIFGGGGEGYAQSEIYNPKQNKFTLTDSLKYPGHTREGLLLKNGEVLIVGGYSVEKRRAITQIEIFDPVKNKIIEAGNTAGIRAVGHKLTLLSLGNVLISGGSTDKSFSQAINETVEIYNPEKQVSVILPAKMECKRTYHTATLLNDGNVLITGGDKYYGTAKSAELFVK